VGNFGDGHIHAFDTNTGTFLGRLRDPDGEPIQIDGLWALKVGNGGNGGDANKLYFTAGLFGETHGLFGSLAPVTPGTPEGAAEAQMVQGALDVVQIDIQTFIADSTSGASQATLLQDLRNLQADQVKFIQAELRFAADVRDDRFPLRPRVAITPQAAKGLDWRALDNLFTVFGQPH
jgi:hypothetical protein